MTEHTDRIHAVAELLHAAPDGLRADGITDEPTLIEGEVLDALRADGLKPTPADARRTVVTRGIDLNALVGQAFSVGEVRCIGRRLCEPCSPPQRLTGTALPRPMVHRGGLRADIPSSGTVCVGDKIVT